MESTQRNNPKRVAMFPNVVTRRASMPISTARRAILAGATSPWNG